MGEYSARVGWDLDFRQLDAGKLRAQAGVMVSSDLIGIRVGFNRGFHQIGQSPSGFWTFGLPDPRCGDFSWCGARVEGGDVLNFNLESGFEGVSKAGFSGYTLSFTDRFLRHAARLLGCDPDVLRYTSGSSAWSGRRASTAELRGRLGTTYRALRSIRGHLAGSRGDAWRIEIAAGLFELIAGEAYEAEPGRYPLRQAAVRRAIELIRDDQRLPMGVAELCAEVGVSSPTLYRGFMETFGIGPKRYLQNRMLEGV
ncbi:MAG: AraC family transcriptional regulator, partial [Gammaproteobacteria bacterium]|nr:AraC family transcriptional regulator [Gammaproteobacteria bacterium]